MGELRLVEPTDAQLLAASRFDGVHFGPVIDRHAPRVHRYLERRLGRPAAETLVAETFGAAYAARRRFRVWDDSAHPWLLGVATGVVRKHWRIELTQLRANDRRRVTPFGSATTRVPRSAEVGAAAVIERLQHLSARDRDIALLATWEDLAPDAIAQALDLPDRVVAGRLAGIGDQVVDDVLAVAADLDVRSAEVGLDLVRALRPVAPLADPDLAGRVRRELEPTVGRVMGADRSRATAAVAAEREQLRRWRHRPGRLSGRTDDRRG